MKKLIFLSAFTLFIFTACSFDEKNAEPAVQEPPADRGADYEPDAPLPLALEEGVNYYDIVLQPWSYEPDMITAKQGDRLVLNITSQGIDRVLAFPDLGVGTHLAPDSTSIFDFTVNQPGTFVSSCEDSCGESPEEVKLVIVVE